MTEPTEGDARRTAFAEALAEELQLAADDDKFMAAADRVLMQLYIRGYVVAPIPPDPEAAADPDDLPRLTLSQFLGGLATHFAPEDEALSAATLRMMIADFRAHARRLLREEVGAKPPAEAPSPPPSSAPESGPQEAAQRP